VNLGDLLDSRVLDDSGRRLGFVIDARFLLEEDDDAGAEPREETVAPPLGAAQLDSLVVSPHTRTSFMGYERSNVSAPIFIARLLSWRHRGSQLLQWVDVARVEPGVVRMRHGYRAEELTDQLDE
jgi:hypothetical protein